MPVHEPGNPKKHIGYFVIADAEGHPLTIAGNEKYLNQLRSRFSNVDKNGQAGSSDILSNLESRAKANLVGNDRISSGDLERLFSDIVQNALIRRAMNGAVGGNISVSDNQDFFRQMLARSLANQQTQLLYIPAEMLVYFANDFHRDGTGKSLYDDSRILHSLASMLLFARVSAGVRNSIGMTNANLKFDPDDPDPIKRIEQTMHIIRETRANNFPVGVLSPVDIVNWLGRCGVEVTWENHPGMPDMSVEFTQKERGIIKPDQELEELLTKRRAQNIGLNPESIDSAYNSEFATSVSENSLLFAKRISVYSNNFTTNFTRLGRLILASDSIILTKLREILIKEKKAVLEHLDGTFENKKFDEIDYNIVVNMCLKDFLGKVEFSLPKPITAKTESQMAKFSDHEAHVDAALKYFVSSEMFKTTVQGKTTEEIETIVAIIKAYFMRDYMARNNIMPELFDLINKNVDGKPSVDIFGSQVSHIEGLMQSLTHFLKDVRVIRVAADKDMDKIDKVLPVDQSGGSDVADTSAGQTTDQFGGGSGDQFPEQGQGQGQAPAQGQGQAAQGQEPAQGTQQAAAQQQQPGATQQPAQKQQAQQVQQPQQGKKDEQQSSEQDKEEKKK